MSDFRVPMVPVLSAFGVPATVTRPAPDDDVPIVTTAIWLPPPLQEERPFGTDFQRRAPRQALALPRDVLASLPRGTLIVAAEEQGQPAKTWRVDELDRVESDHWRAIVVPVAS